MLSRPSVLALQDSLRTIAISQPAVLTDACRAALKDRVCAVVDELKAEGLPPERVIVAVKQMAQEAGLSPSRGVLTVAPLAGRDALVVGMISWCIERYYGPSPGRA